MLATDVPVLQALFYGLVSIVFFIIILVIWIIKGND